MSADKLAIAGMDAWLPGIEGLAGFEGGLYRGAERPRRPGPPPQEDELLRQVCRSALADARLPEGARVALLAALGSRLAASIAGEPPAEDPALSALAAQLGGPLVDLSAHGNPLAAGLEEASRLLAAGEAEAVLIAAASLARSFSGLPERLHQGGPAFGFERSVDGWMPGDGAGAVVLVRARPGTKAYALVLAAGWGGKDLPGLRKSTAPGLLSSETVLESCLSAFAQAGCAPGDVGYLEAFAGGFTPLDSAEIGGLARAYRAGGGGLSCALGSAQADAGYTFTAAGVLALARAALCLRRRVIPSAGQWSGPKKPDLWAGTPFYVETAARTWFLESGQTQRIAAVNLPGRDARCAHVLLGEAPGEPEPAGVFLAARPGVLIPLAASSPERLADSLAALQERLDRGAGGLPELAREHFERFQLAGDEAGFALALVAAGLDEARREVDFALRDVPLAAAQNRPWQTPAGSYFTPQPVGRRGGVAFVYPGAFNSYLGLGRDLFLLFPGLYERASRVTADLSATIQSRRLYPRSLEALDPAQLAGLEAQLGADPVAMITTGSLIAVLYTIIVRDIFKIQPAAAFGYSLGEIAMLFGTGVWAEADASRERLRASPLFQSRLAGPQLAVREHWGLQGGASQGAIWANYFLMAPPEQVAGALASEPHVYLTHVNTPRQVVIGGDPLGCRRVIEALKCTSLKAPFDFALHCEAIRGEYEGMTTLHTWPVAARPEIALYSAAGCRPLALESCAIAESISAMLCSCLDFPALVRQVYADGARVFIELGANANCSKWIEETLKGSPHAAVAANRRGADDHTTLLRMLARLVSHRVPLDLTPLYPSGGGIY